MRVLVTGANGFLGASLCKHLIGRGDEVRGLVRETSDCTVLDGVPVQRIVGALDDMPRLKEAVRGIDLIYHVAAAVSDWGTREYFQKGNVEGTGNILKAVIEAGVRRFVFVSTISVHSFIGGQDLDENAIQLPTPFLYCQTKREAEALVMAAHKQHKIAVTIVRPGDVFGPGDRTSLLKMAEYLEKGKMAYVDGGRKLGAFTYVENLNEGLVLAGILDKAVGETYVMTDGIRLTWREYIDKLIEELDLPRPKISIHPLPAYCAATILEWIYRMFRLTSRPPITRYLIAHVRKDFHFGIQKAARDLGYAPAIGIDEAIRRTAAWYRQQREKSKDV
jgi:nucleoside-diphosphate-sugar epimerase